MFQTLFRLFSDAQSVLPDERREFPQQQNYNNPFLPVCFPEKDTHLQTPAEALRRADRGSLRPFQDLSTSDDNLPFLFPPLSRNKDTAAGKPRLLSANVSLTLRVTCFRNCFNFARQIILSFFHIIIIVYR